MNKIRYFVQGVIALLVMSTNTIVLTLVIFVLAVFKLLVPYKPFRYMLTRWLSWLGELWISINKLVLWFYRGMVWDIQLPEVLDLKSRYLVMCNHQSWVDILVLQSCLNRRAPFMRFFLKKKLAWVPFLGVAWWALDMPFLRRHTQEEMLKNPSLRGKDLENAAPACEKLKHIPVSMMSFPEGTRFSQLKHSQQNSWYQHLLSPSFGGIGQVFYCFGDALQSAIDVTIYYPDGVPIFWQLVSGQIRKISVRAKLRPVDQSLRGVWPNYSAPSAGASSACWYGAAC